MTCKDCPEFMQRPGEHRGLAVIVYTGGPLNATFTHVRRALTPDQEGVITKWSCPQVHPDGAIEYQQNEAEPPQIEGYQKDASNSRLLRPVWPHCAWRLLRVWREDTGAVSISAGCLNPDTGLGADVTLRQSQCQNCQHRQV